MSKQRRALGEGSVFQCSRDQRWVARLNLGYVDGRLKRWESYCHSQQEALDRLIKARSDLARNLPIKLERQTLSQFLERWLEQSVKPSVRPATYQQYHQHVRLYLGPTSAGMSSQSCLHRISSASSTNA